MHTTPLPDGCTGRRYAINDDHPDEGTDIAHDIACPAHPDATLTCAWCGRLTVVNRPATRGYAVGGKTVGELCPSCAADSYDYDAEARAYSPDPPSPW